MSVVIFISGKLCILCAYSSYVYSYSLALIKNVEKKNELKSSSFSVGKTFIHELYFESKVHPNSLLSFRTKDKMEFFCTQRANEGVIELCKIK